MATLTIKNVPEALVQRLKRKAAAHRRSLNNEVIVNLESMTQATRLDPEALLARARAVRRTPLRVRVTDQTLNRLKRHGHT